MSDTAPLSLVGLLEELHQVTDWYMLGVYLELPREELSQIERKFESHGLRRCQTELFDLWMKSNPKASWELIAAALEKCGEKALAEDVRKRHSSLLVVSAGDKLKLPASQDEPVRVELEKTLVKRFTKLERAFAIIVKDLKKALEGMDTPLKDLHRFLEARLEQSGEYMQATDIDEVFQQISPHYCFLNITLLEDITATFVGEPLKRQLEEYEKQLEEFTSSTKITVLKVIQSQRPPHNAEGMSHVVLKLKGFWLSVTIKRFQKFVSQIFGAKSDALTHIRVEDGCICISWLTRESAIPSLVALAQQKVEFMRHVGVLRLTVGDITVLKKEGEDDQEEEEDANLTPALLRATTSGCVEAVQFLLSLGADPNCASEDGATPLILACERGSFIMIEELLKAHASVNEQDREGKTALMKVCNASVGNEDLVKLLLQSGADVRIQSSTGWTALMYATVRGHSHIVQLLLNEGAAVNAQTRTGVTSLMLACHYSHPDIVPLLLSYGADPNIQDQYNYTALMFACSKQLTSAVELLLAHGADPNLSNEGGSTALMCACYKYKLSMDPSIPVLLLSAGANLNAVTFNGLTALMIASICGYHAGIKVLLNAKADTNTRNIDGTTALHFASQKGHLSITKLLLAAGANASLVNKDGKTALDLALAGSHHDVRQLLLVHMDPEPPLTVSETEHSPHTQHQTHPHLISSSFL